MPFWEYELRAERLCLGERLKGGLFRPCDTHSIRYSAITGALRSAWGEEVHAAGYFIQEPECNLVSYLTYAPRDDLTGVSKLPLTIQFLTNVLGRIVIKTQRQSPPQTFEMTMGAMKSQGFGNCQCRLLGSACMTPILGQLRTRLPVHRVQDFEIQQVITPSYGYLFEPTLPFSGEYVLAILEGSIIYGPKCLVKEEK
jgi:hypothetical protein